MLTILELAKDAHEFSVNNGELVIEACDNENVTETLSN